ncbi:uroporphyrinogen decarboxylase family protein [Methanolobus sp. ZRKC3]|uniref:uroporphyrinogen decarboxylase family protein n=1 Tax=Methanolobus sp. ZRKC3 TaxID=3125786 RepID=UPI00324754F6
MKEEMTSKERFVNALEMDEVDRVPYGYLWFGAGDAVLDRMGASMKDVYYSSKGIAKAQILAREMYHHDNVMSPWGCLLAEAEAFGARVNIKDNGYPTMDGYLLDSASEYEKIDPDKFVRSERVGTVLDSISLLKKELKDEVFITGCILPPLTLAFQLLDMTDLSMAMLTEKEDAHALLDNITESCLLYADKMLEAGADGILFDNGGSTGDLFSIEMAEEFMLKYTKKVYRCVQANGGYVISHNCAVHAFHEMELTMSPDALNFSYGEVDFLKEKYGIDCVKTHQRSGCAPRYCLKELAYSGICLMGNIDSNVFGNGSFADIDHEVKSCMEAAPETGFILSTGCEIPLSTSQEKMDTLWNSVKSHF